MAESTIAKVIDERLDTNVKKVRFATSGNNYSTLRWYTSNTDYIELVFNSSDIVFRSNQNGTITTIWTK